MSDPRFERDPNLPGSRRYDRASNSGNAIWISLVLAIIVVLGILAYTYRNHVTASNSPSTTAGQSTRTQTPATPPAAPAQR
jgi:hypothetical protein